jgi:hypothetical protein
VGNRVVLGKAVLPRNFFEVFDRVSEVRFLFWRHVLKLLWWRRLLPSKLTGVFEKVADEANLPILEFEPRHPFIFVRLVLSANPLIGPVNGNPLPLGDHSLDLKVQFRILPEEDVKELDDPLLADKELRFWKREACIFLEKTHHVINHAAVHAPKKLGG